MGSAPLMAEQPSSGRIRPSTVIAWILAAITAVSSAILATPVVESWFRGYSLPSAVVFEGLVAGIVPAFVLFVTYYILSRRSHRLSMSKRAKAEVLPSALREDWKEMGIRVQNIYSRGSRRLESFVNAAQRIQVTAFSQPPTSEAAQVVNATINTYIQNRSVDTALVWVLDNFERHGADDENALWALKDLIDSEVTSGAIFADNLVSLIRQAIPSNSMALARDNWGRFRDPANRLGEALTSLERRTFSALGQGTVITPMSIRDI